LRGQVAFEYDPELNTVFTEDDWHVETREDVEAFFADYNKYFSALGKKVYMISHIDKLLVQAQVADYFGELARALVYKHLLGFARYGTDSWARMTVRTTSHIAKMTPNIYTTRAEAVRAIDEMRKAGLKPEQAPEKTGLT
jgi:hypothetical protein